MLHHILGNASLPTERENEENILVSIFYCWEYPFVNAKKRIAYGGQDAYSVMGRFYIARLLQNETLGRHSAY
ncbi:hypothetical protein VK70_21310 [Paenibacillus durus ATCC 35681]|uniref:Uncharacterized protein n=1 Tax=Paenibacillus durus ATCC 35681 TaxID=1333534 RepID=A0A0F7FD65_PAEDU|nr:hypothetical protein VK70_21310 [Paenibacillus durus ATCC 35681]